MRGEVNTENVIVGSMDIEALYPSLDTKRAGEVVRDRILAFQLKFDGIDWRWALVYLALTMSNVEKVWIMTF